MGPINIVNSRATNRVNDLEAEDTLVAIAEADNGRWSQCKLLLELDQLTLASVNIYGDKGYIEVGVALNEIVVVNMKIKI